MHTVTTYRGIRPEQPFMAGADALEPDLSQVVTGLPVRDKAQPVALLTLHSRDGQSRRAIT